MEKQNGLGTWMEDYHSLPSLELQEPENYLVNAVSVFSIGVSKGFQTLHPGIMGNL